MAPCAACAACAAAAAGPAGPLPASGARFSHLPQAHAGARPGPAAVDVGERGGKRARAVHDTARARPPSTTTSTAITSVATVTAASAATVVTNPPLPVPAATTAAAAATATVTAVTNPAATAAAKPPPPLPSRLSFQRRPQRSPATTARAIRRRQGCWEADRKGRSAGVPTPGGFPQREMHHPRTSLPCSPFLPRLRAPPSPQHMPPAGVGQGAWQQGSHRGRAAVHLAHPLPTNPTTC